VIQPVCESFSYAKVWYIGLLGKLAGTLYGADLGFEVCFFRGILFREEAMTILIYQSLQLRLQQSYILRFGG
jgi:hypothetical protein